MIKISTKKFDPKNPPDGIWVKYAEGAEIQIRKINKEIYRALREPFVTLKMEYDPIEHKYVEKETEDKEKLEEASLAYLIQDFRGFGDDDGNVLPDTMESRKALDSNMAISEFIWGFARAVETVTAKKAQEKIKN